MQRKKKYIYIKMTTISKVHRYSRDYIPSIGIYSGTSSSLQDVSIISSSTILTSTSGIYYVDSRSNSSITITLPTTGTDGQIISFGLLFDNSSNVIISIPSKGNVLLTPQLSYISLQYTTKTFTTNSTTQTIGWTVVNDPNVNSLYTTGATQTKLVANNNVGNSNQGRGLAISADGNTLAVGGSGDNSLIGAVWIWTRNPATNVWTQGDKLIGTGATGTAQQGRLIALNADGTTLAVGGRTDNSSAGAVWIFVKSGGVWAQQGSKLVGTGATGAAQQGQSVSLSADGNTLAVGGNADNSNVGAVWIWTRSGSTWTQVGSKLTPSDGVTAQFGACVSLNAAGTILLVGGDTDNTNVGAAWIFTKIGNSWSQYGNKLVGTGAVGQSRQGLRLALSADGQTAVVGGFNDNSGVGALWIYKNLGSSWVQQGSKIVPTDYLGTTPNFGNGVAVSGDGNTLFIGGQLDNSTVGANWVLRRTGLLTYIQNKIVPLNLSASSLFGANNVISSDGTIAASGAYDNVESGTTTGAVVVLTT